MVTYDARKNGVSYDAILNALAAQSPTQTIRTLRNRAKFIAERALEMPSRDRVDFVNRKVWEG